MALLGMPCGKTKTKHDEQSLFATEEEKAK
jgi:hypothetical protein